jgi:TPR repeat protein/tRNA A-37 threonylcarbamoyl transferase component Bud32
VDDSSRGKRLDRFEVMSLLGKGATGTVYRARDLVAGREVALKVLLHTRLGDRQRARFQREGELTAALDHPGIVRVHSAGELPSGAPFLAYELVEGARTLGDACAAEPDLARKVSWVRDAARALGVAHARGIVHRDVKPDNLLVDVAGRLKVADFGAAWASGAERLTVTGAAVGTPYFMCPEQLAGEGLPATPAWDVWALGVTLYVVLTGQYPFDAAGLDLLTMRVVASDPEAPSARNAAVSPALETVCLRCLEKEPAARYADGEALAADLERVLAGQPVQARRRRVGRLLRRRVLLVALPVMALGVVLVAAAQALSPPPVVSSPPRRAARPAPTAPARPPAASTLGAPEVPSPPPPPPPPPHEASLFGRTAWELAHADEPASMRVVASYYREGLEGFPRDTEEAVRWLERGAALGDPACMVSLAELVEGGEGAPRDAARATALRLRAAELDFHDAFKQVALAYEQGHGVAIDRARAVHWYDRHHAVHAVDDDFTRPHAARLLLAGGAGLPKDVARAVTLLEESAGAGNEEAMFTLGLMYRDGLEVPRDLARARALLEQGARSGSARAEKALLSLPTD